VLINPSTERQFLSELTAHRLGELDASLVLPSRYSAHADDSATCGSAAHIDHEAFVLLEFLNLDRKYAVHFGERSIADTYKSLEQVILNFDFIVDLW
jgi:hypothetical protein